MRPPLPPPVTVVQGDGPPTCKPCGRESREGAPLVVVRLAPSEHLVDADGNPAMVGVPGCPRCGREYPRWWRSCRDCTPDEPPVMEPAGGGAGSGYWQCPRCGWQCRTTDHVEPTLLGEE